MTSNSQKITIPELLAPAGSLEKLASAVHFGADAVYMGGGPYSLRAHAVFERERLAEAVAYAHNHGVKAYVTVNILAHNRDLDGLGEYLPFLADIGVDGLIIADPGIVMTARQSVPQIPIHLSTQANTTNRAAAAFWESQGVSRLNLARELSLKEIQEVRKATKCALEIFVHGAICISYSGRCSLSLYMTGRDANLGNCAHPCRYRYVLEEEKRPGKFFPVEEDERGAYIFNSQDLCLLRRLPELILAGADSLKIEGRMKSVYYVGAITRLYRGALDYIAKVMAAEGIAALKDLKLPAKFLEELPKIGSRGYTENFIDGAPKGDNMLFEGIRVQQTHAPIAIIRQAGDTPLVETRNTVFPGERAEVIGPGFQKHSFTIDALIGSDGTPLEKANPGNLIHLKTTPDLRAASKGDLIRRRQL